MWLVYWIAIVLKQRLNGRMIFMLMEKKICGILVETILDPDLKGVIVGIGLNVNNEDFQSMKQITHKEYKISKLANWIENIYVDLL